MIAAARRHVNRFSRTRAGTSGRTASRWPTTIAPCASRFIAAECEPWAKTGGLGDVVDALARALGRMPEAGPSRRAGRRVPAPLPVRAGARRRAATGPRSRSPIRSRRRAARPSPLLDVAADGYRLRLVDLPAAFDRATFYDHPDDAWRFGVFCRAALARPASAPARRSTCSTSTTGTRGPAALLRAARGDRRRPGHRPAAVALTLHNLAYHGWVRQRGARPARARRRATPLAGARTRTASTSCGPGSSGRSW